MQMRRFDGSSDWVAPAAAVDAVSLSMLTSPVSAVGRRAVAFFGTLAALVLALSFAS
jgi:hypothetical protein